MKNFDTRPLSFRLARALMWFDASLEQRKVAIQVLEEVGEDATDDELPTEFQEMLAWASRVASQMPD
jgi:hypothetical protein